MTTNGLTLEQQIGAAAIICYIRDFITLSPRQSYSQCELLVLLEAVSRDTDFFPTGIGADMWGMDVEDSTC